MAKKEEINDKNKEKADKRKKTIERQKQEARDQGEKTLNRAHDREMQQMMNEMDRSDGIRIEIHISNIVAAEMVKAGGNANMMPALTIPEEIVHTVCEHVGTELVNQALEMQREILTELGVKIDNLDGTLSGPEPEPDHVPDNKQVKET